MFGFLKSATEMERKTVGDERCEEGRAALHFVLAAPPRSPARMAGPLRASLQKWPACAYSLRRGRFWEGGAPRLLVHRHR